MITTPIDTFKTAATYTVTRRAAQTVTDGIVTLGATSSVSITAVVQPLRGKDLEVLPEARHARDVRMIHTRTALRVDSSAGAADVVTIGGEAYTVIHVEEWTIRGSTFYRCYAARNAGAP